MSKNIRLKAYGKLNLYLDITGRREDGYHLLKSVMQSVTVYDVIDFSIPNDGGIHILCDDKSFPADKRNLIWKACEAFYRYTGVSRKGLIARVKKNIPSMAGMAGGSADCAAALYALNALYGTELDLDRLCEIGAALGADVPFTLMGGTVLCEGIGERLTRLPDISGLWFAIVKPEAGISTPEAYRIYDNSPQIDSRSYEDFERAVRDNSAKGIADGIFNALEIAAGFEEIKTAKSDMFKYGALGSMMTGSGSAVFGIFDSRSGAERCISQMSGYSFARVAEPVGCGFEII